MPQSPVTVTITAEIHKLHTISGFTGPHAFLSNFYRLPTPIHYLGVSYTTTEAAYQAQKTLDPLKRESISRYYDPWAAKRAGSNLPDLRVDWEEVKNEVMLEVLDLKFEIPELGEMLRGTGYAVLIEGNRHHDNHFGVCYCNTSRCKGKVGINMLGKLLMLIRGRLT
jgi:ribA/ribD-fused uncharacterized protein